MTGTDRLAVLEGANALMSIAAEWNRLAAHRRSPFRTVEWILAWWAAFGHGELTCIAHRGPEGEVRSGAVLGRRRGQLQAPANDHSGDWGPVAADGQAERWLWEELGRSSASRLVLSAVPEGEVDEAARALAGAGYRLVSERGPFSPYLELPPDFDALLAGRSANLRGQLGRRRRALEREGRLTFRTTTGGSGLERDLESAFRVEAAGWKARSGTAILSQEASHRLYREFAAAAAANGWLRLHLLELDGVAIAADFGCVFGEGEHLLKTGYDERWGRFSPGLVLRAEVLRSAIEEGLRFYDFLGPSDAYKLRWTDEVRPRVTLRAFRGLPALPAFAYRRRLRPVLKRVRARTSARGRASAHRARA